MDIQEFIKNHGITMTSRKAKSNPNMADFKANHYTVTISYDGNSMSVPYSMGLGLSGSPEIEDVLDCLASDASGIENARNFEDWAAEYGYDRDSRKAEKTYNQCKKQSRELNELLGRLYPVLLWEVERK